MTSFLLPAKLITQQEKTAMKTIAQLTLTAAVTLITSHASLADTPPASAKKLDGKGIAELYEGAYATFDNVRDKVKGEIFYSIKSKVMFGIYRTAKGDAGIFRGKARVKGDQFCYKTSAKEVCQNVYVDGNVYYETNADGTITSIDTLQLNPPKLPASAAKIPAAKVLELVKGKRLFVTVHDSEKPLVADVKWDAKKSWVDAKFISGGKPEGKAKVKFKVKGDMICFPDDKSENCYVYHELPNGFVEINDKGAVHAISTY
jgi:hypothetical protein